MSINGVSYFKPKKNFFMVDDKFAKEIISEIGGIATSVYIVLKSYCDFCYPSQETLRKRCGVGKSSIIDAIKVLEVNGLLGS